MINYGFRQHNLLRAIHVESTDGGMAWRFDALGPFGVWQDIHLPMPGRHNVLTALAAIGVAWSLGINTWVFGAALASIELNALGGALKLSVRQPVRMVDDYGHHPTEIALTLTAAKASTRKRLASIAFSRIALRARRALLEQFAACFSATDAVFLLPVYSAGETEIEGANHEALAAAIRRAGTSAGADVRQPRGSGGSVAPLVARRRLDRDAGRGRCDEGGE